MQTQKSGSGSGQKLPVAFLWMMPCRVVFPPLRPVPFSGRWRKAVRKTCCALPFLEMRLVCVWDGLAASPGDQRPSAAAAVAAALALSGASPEKLAMGVANAVNGAPVQSMGEWAAKPGQGLAAVAGWRARAGSEGRFSLPEWALDPEPELMGMLAIKTLAGPAFA